MANLGHRAEVAVQPSVHVDTGLQAHWNSKLSISEGNPYPLAPVDLVRMGLVDSVNYREENEKVAKARTMAMRTELKAWRKEPGFGQLQNYFFEIDGAGLFRGFGFIKMLLKLKFVVIIRDNSSVACDNARRSLKQARITGCQCQVDHCETQACWKSGEVDKLRTAALYFPQFMQVQTPEVKDSMMRYIGEWLSNTMGHGIPPRRAYFVHARRMDNQSPRLWGSQTLPGVEWGDTRPYDDPELLTPAQEGFGDTGRLELQVLSQHSYFHQTYSFMRLMAAAR